MNRTLALFALLALLALATAPSCGALDPACGSRVYWGGPLISFPSFSTPGSNYDRMADEIAEDLDKELAPRLAGNRRAYYVAVTVPADLHALDKTSALSRLMAQEIADNLTARGYNVQEMRKGREIVFDRRKGETILTRNVADLAHKDVAATLVVAGTYSAAPGGTRFNVEVIEARNNNVVAMASRTVSAGPDNDEAFGGAAASNGLNPTVVTTQGLRRNDYLLP